jgi:hypothetical protein
MTFYTFLGILIILGVVAILLGSGLGIAALVTSGGWVVGLSALLGFFVWWWAN